MYCIVPSYNLPMSSRSYLLYVFILRAVEFADVATKRSTYCLHNKLCLFDCPVFSLLTLPIIAHVRGAFAESSVIETFRTTVPTKP